MSDTPQFQASDRVVATDLPDGTAVLLHLDTKFYYTLNTTAARVFRVLQAGKAPRATLTATLVAQFACTEADAERDVAALLDDLIADALVVVSHG